MLGRRVACCRGRWLIGFAHDCHLLQRRSCVSLSYSILRLGTDISGLGNANPQKGVKFGMIKIMNLHSPGTLVT
jgi:hypothetical protein